MLSDPEAFKVSVEALLVLPEPLAPPDALICASLATVRSPTTATVTLAVSSAEEIAAAVLASITIPSGSSNQLPFLPNGADVSTLTLAAIVN